MPLTRCRAARRATNATATRLFALLEEQLKLNPSLVRLFKMFFVFVLLWHWVGCLWLFVFQMEYVDVELAELIGRAAIAGAATSSATADARPRAPRSHKYAAAAGPLRAAAETEARTPPGALAPPLLPLF